VRQCLRTRGVGGNVDTFQKRPDIKKTPPCALCRCVPDLVAVVADARIIFGAPIGELCRLTLHGGTNINAGLSVLDTVPPIRTRNVLSECDADRRPMSHDPKNWTAVPGGSNTYLPFCACCKKSTTFYGGGKLSAVSSRVYSLCQPCFLGAKGGAAIESENEALASRRASQT
jgi:hypothetical protein